MTHQSFDEIYTSIRSRLTGLACQFGKAASIDLDAEDVVQEAMVAFWRLSEQGYPVRNPEALLVRITKNICISRLRKRRLRTEPVTGDNYIGGEVASLGIDRSEEARIRQKVYECLTKTERAYMLLKTEEGLTLDEICQKTGNSKSGIKTALSKARKKIERQLKRIGYDR